MYFKYFLSIASFGLSNYFSQCTSHLLVPAVPSVVMMTGQPKETGLPGIQKTIHNTTWTFEWMMIPEEYGHLRKRHHSKVRCWWKSTWFRREQWLYYGFPSGKCTFDQGLTPNGIDYTVHGPDRSDVSGSCIFYRHFTGSELLNFKWSALGF